MAGEKTVMDTEQNLTDIGADITIKPPEGAMQVPTGTPTLPTGIPTLPSTTTTVTAYHYNRTTTTTALQLPPLQLPQLLPQGHRFSRITSRAPGIPIGLDRPQRRCNLRFHSHIPAS